jgi:hypothetical protein
VQSSNTFASETATASTVMILRLSISFLIVGGAYAFTGRLVSRFVPLRNGPRVFDTTALTASNVFEVRELDKIGKAIVATDFIKAGTIIHREKPLMHVTPIVTQQYRGLIEAHEEGIMGATNIFFEQMNSEQQNRYLSLYGGNVSGPRGKHLLDNLAVRMKFNGVPATQAQKESFVRVALIYINNWYDNVLEPGESMIYDTASRFCHSCDSNCEFSFVGPEIVVKTRKPVQAGEELTTDYYNLPRWWPIHRRRYSTLEIQDFTCTCPRCEALGDDTRQFHCYDPGCSGLHRARQPINKDQVPFGTTHEGVEYVEPHLLPCNACQRSPPLVYQTAMLELEKQWNKELEELPEIVAMPMFTKSPGVTPTGQLFYLMRPKGMLAPRDIPAMVEKLEDLHYHVSHAAGFYLALHELRGRLELFKLGHTSHRYRLQQLVTEMDLFFDHFFSAPCEQYSTFLTDMYAAYNHLGDSANAARLFKRLIHGERILRGREEASVSEMLFALAAPYTGGGPRAGAFSSTAEEGCCVYCGESPKHAAVAMGDCGACNKVVYCGKACQTAHWELHKAECKAV